MGAGLSHFGKDDGKRIERHRFDQHQGQDQCELNRRPCSRITSQTLAGGRCRLRLRVPASCGGDRHGEAGGDPDPLMIGSRRAFWRLSEGRRRDEQPGDNRKEHPPISFHYYLLWPRTTSIKSSKSKAAKPLSKFPPGGGCPTPHRSDGPHTGG